MINIQEKKCIIVFLRSPDIGKVKTRMSTVLGEEIVLKLYKCFVEDLIETIKETGYPLVLCHYPKDAGFKIRKWLDPNFSLMGQVGVDLGERMSNAFKRIFKDGFKRAVLIGTDFPDLDPGIIHQAFEGLIKADAVIGKTLDGGYYIIGFNSATFVEDIFKNITWGEKDVFQKTMTCFKEKNVSVFKLPKWLDIDTYQDLVNFNERLKEKKHTAIKTKAFLSTISL